MANIADLIDRDEFMRLVQEAYQAAAEKAGTHFKDIVQVVRCKDCKHSNYWYADKWICELWTECGVSVFGDGFCSYGERREDGKTD